MDRSLDEIVAERHPSTSRSRRPPPRRNNYPRDGVRKSTREDRADLDSDWVHDRFDDDRDSQRPPRGGRNRRDDHGDRARLSPEGETTAKVRVDNLHWELTEDDLTDLFERIAPVEDLKLTYDRAGRSNGTAYVTYGRVTDAKAAIREFDGANAKGQPIRLTLLPSAPSGGRGRGQNPFFSDRVERPARSLFDRIERPRSASPGGEGYGSERPRRRGLPRERRNDGRLAPEGIDRYVPGQSNRSPVRRGRGDGGRRPGQRRDERKPTDDKGRKLVGGRPRMTQEELDAEMADYWKGAEHTNGADNAATEAAPAAETAPAAVVDDIDMIE